MILSKLEKVGPFFGLILRQPSVVGHPIASDLEIEAEQQAEGVYFGESVRPRAVSKKLLAISCVLRVCRPNTNGS